MIRPNEEVKALAMKQQRGSSSDHGAENTRDSICEIKDNEHRWSASTFPHT